MFRWESVEPVTIDGMTVKMYRPPYEAEEVQKVPYQNTELDHFAFKYLGSELFMYKILDTNFINFMEERGDITRIKDIYIPAKEAL